MRVFVRAALVAALALAIVGPASAEPYYGGTAAPPKPRDPQPVASASAAAFNTVFTPIRFAVTVVGAALGGLTGFLTAGDIDAADDIWGLFDGQNFVTPAIVSREEPLRLGQMEFMRP